MKSIAVRLLMAAMVVAGLQVGWAQELPEPRGMAQSERAQMDRQRPGLEHTLSIPGMQGRWWMMPRAVETLKITEEQQKAMDSILIEYREKLIDLRAGLQKTELKLEQLVTAEKLDEGAITAQIDRVAQARAELEKANAHYLLAVWGRLTPEQRVQVKQFREKMRSSWGQGPMRQHMMRNAPGPMAPAEPGAPPAPAAPEGK